MQNIKKLRDIVYYVFSYLKCISDKRRLFCHNTSFIFGCPTISDSLNELLQLHIRHTD